MVSQINGKLSELSGWEPYSTSLNVTFADGVGFVTIPGKKITQTALAVQGVWNTNFSGIASADDGKISIRGFEGTTSATGTYWIAMAGIIKV